MADGCALLRSAPTSCVCPWPPCCLRCTTGLSGYPRGRPPARPTPCPVRLPLLVPVQRHPPHLLPPPACSEPPAGQDCSRRDCHGAAATAAAQRLERRPRPCTERRDSLARPHRGLRQLPLHHWASPAASSPLAVVLIQTDFHPPHSSLGLSVHLQ